MLFLGSGDDKVDEHRYYDGSIAFTPYLQEEAQWLAREIASQAFQTAQWRVVYMHIGPKPESADPAVARTLYETLVPLLNQAKIDLLLCGHEHAYQCCCGPEAAAKGVQFPFLIGDSHPLNKATMTKLTITPTSLQATVLRHGGQVVTNLLLPR